jgi:hypothetical protein
MRTTQNRTNLDQSGSRARLKQIRRHTLSPDETNRRPDKTDVRVQSVIYRLENSSNPTSVAINRRTRRHAATDERTNGRTTEALVQQSASVCV